METSLHRTLKQRYTDDSRRVEVPLDGYRIDVIAGGRLIEIQHGSLAAIRDKVRRLIKTHRLTLVKPIVRRKRLVKLRRKGGKTIGIRRSPKRGSLTNLFDELVYFTRVFPHPNLLLEVLLVDIDEYRYPGHGRRRRHRKGDYQIEDQSLAEIHEVHRFQTATDLLTVIPENLAQPFHTGDLAESMRVERWIAQRVAYCLRETGAVTQIGKNGNTRLYQITESKRLARAA